MMVRQAMFDEFFKNQLPDDGFTLEEVYRDYFGLINQANADRPELHGHVVGLDGHVRIPELAPTLNPVFVARS
jgi:hypothetical protein